MMGGRPIIPQGVTRGGVARDRESSRQRQRWAPSASAPRSATKFLHALPAQKHGRRRMPTQQRPRTRSPRRSRSAAKQASYRRCGMPEQCRGTASTVVLSERTKRHVPARSRTTALTVMIPQNASILVLVSRADENPALLSDATSASPRKVCTCAGSTHVSTRSSARMVQ